MKTKITFPFVVKSVDMGFISILMQLSGLNDVIITGVDQDGDGITFTANRHLSDAEKATVKQVFLALIIQISDLP